MPKVVAFLPAKAESERIKSKNTALLDGKPLFLHTLEKLTKCDFIDTVYLDSESDTILNYAPYLNYIPFKRDSALASNKTDGHAMFYNEVSKVDADIYIQILGTSPFIFPETIKKGVDVLIQNPEYDSVVLVKRDKQYLWKDNQPSYDKNKIPNSVDLPDTVIETMGLYIVRRDTALSERKRFGSNVYLLEASPIEAVDINAQEDFALANAVAKGIRAKKAADLRILANQFNSAIFSDILEAKGLHTVIPGLAPNLPNIKLLGRANTLKIRKLRNGEDYRGIYDALDTYAKIGEGEIIIVENEVSDRAYFGELNANLALRSGACGAIIGGMTRDAREVMDINYPVFSAGYCCADVRGVATMESHNMPIRIRGVDIIPGDLVFADVNGIVVIPQRVEDEVLTEVIQAIHKEKTVLDKIMCHQDAKQIYESEGAF